jgi:hypothetical protein
MTVLRGGCLCGAVQYEVEDDFRYMGYCHCSECRRFSGSASAAVGGVPYSALRTTQGEESIARYQKSPKTELCFCRICGSSLYSRKLDREMLHVRLGSLMDSPSMKPSLAITCLLDRRLHGNRSTTIYRNSMRSRNGYDQPEGDSCQRLPDIQA